MSGTDSAAGRAWSEIRATNWSSVAPVAASDFETDSVEGQRARPSGVMRFDLLNVVGSRPARLASPDAESPARAANRSIAVQICACVNMVGLPQVTDNSTTPVNECPRIGIITCGPRRPVHFLTRFGAHCAVAPLRELHQGEGG